MNRWRFAWAWTIGVVLALPGCGGSIPIPDDCRLLGCPDGLVCTEGDKGTWSCQAPPPCEETGCPDGQVCVAGKCEPKPPWTCPIDAPWCHEMDPPQMCSTPESPCVHNPTNNPEHCELAPACDVDPDPSEPGCRFPQGLADEAFHPVEPAPANAHHADVNAALRKVSGCDAGRCVIEGGPQPFFAAVAAELRERGLCAGQHDEGHTDEIAVAARPGPGQVPTRWYGYHVYAGDDSGEPGSRGTVAWSPGAYAGAYDVDLPGPPAGTCSWPRPPKVGRWGGPKPHLAWFDTTPKFYDRLALGWDGLEVEGYCNASGSPATLWCPARPEGNPERLACERYGVSGDVAGVPLWRSDGDVEVKPDNPFQARCSSCTWIEVCAADATRCSRTAVGQ